MIDVDKMTNWELWQAGKHLEDDRYDPAILQALIKRGDMQDLFRVGRDWCDERYSHAVLWNLMATRDPDKSFWLKMVFKYWSLERVPLAARVLVYTKADRYLLR